MASEFTIRDGGRLMGKISVEDMEQYKLWVVVVNSPRGVETVHVLAADEERAKGQAECFLAFQVPFAVEGWGDARF